MVIDYYPLLFMKLKVLLPSVLTTMLLSGYPLVEAVYAQQPANGSKSVWQQFTSPQGKFMVLMPGKPKPVKQSYPTPLGVINSQGFLVENYGKKVAYLVAYSDFPINLKSNNSNQILDWAGKGILGGVNGKLVSQRSFKLQGFPGRELTYLATGGIFKHRMYLVNRRLYQVVVATSKEQQKYLAKSNVGFLNSFRLRSQ